jgi:hypothetical protein
MVPVNDKSIVAAASRVRLEGGFMKKLHAILFVFAALLMATAVQAQQTSIKATVPFDFIVGDRVYLAGEYTITPTLSSDNVLRITGGLDNQKALLPSNTCRNTDPSAETKLIFRRMGGSYFLAQVWVEGRTAGREFPKSQSEVRWAKYHEKPEVVVVAANLAK